MFQSFPVSDSAAHQKRRRNRQPKACQPCRARKLRCDFNQPCDRCIKRSHESLCVYGVFKDDIEKDQAQTAASSTPASFSSPSSHIELPGSHSHEQSSGHNAFDFLLNPATEPEHGRDGLSDLLDHIALRTGSVYEDEELTGETAFFGLNSQLAFFCRLCDWLAVKGERSFLPPGITASSAFCLSNRTSLHPFGSLWRPTATVKLEEILAALPGAETCLRYYDAYQTSIHPFRPFVSRIEVFERRLCQLLENKRNTGSMHDPNHTELFETPKYFAWFGLFFAVLAGGCWMSDDMASDRVLTARVFVASAYQCLRLANLYVSPSTESVEAMLLLGYVIANDSNPGAAWSLLAQTTRQAESIGLHSHSPSHPIWRIIIQMDSTSTMAFDRPPVSFVPEMEDFMTPLARSSEISTADFVHAISSLKVQWQMGLFRNSQSGRRATNVESYMRRLRHIESTMDSVSQRVEDSFIRRHTERLDLTIQIRHFQAELARHASLATELGYARRSQYFYEMIGNLRSVVESFIALKDFSSRLTRAWTLLHYCFSSVMTLAVIERATGDYQSKYLFTDVLNSLAPGADGQNVSEEANRIAMAPYKHSLHALKQILETYPR